MKKKGFTLVELLAVVAIIAILVIIVLPNVLKLFKNAKKDSFEVEVKAIYDTAREQFLNSTFNGQSKKKIYCNNGTCEEKLKLSGGNKINYSIKVDRTGKVICLQASNGEYYYISEKRLKDNSEILSEDIHDVSEEGINITPDCTQSIDIRAITDIKVLNIYPDTTSGTYRITSNTGNFVSSIDGKTYNLLKSASLKRWMEEANPESSNGYGKGLIKVTPVGYKDFNSNPSILRNYDLIFIGTWDANGTSEFNDAGIKAIKDWIKEGKPIIIGHDTFFYSTADATATNGTKKFSGDSELRNLFNIKLYNYDNGFVVSPNNRDVNYSTQVKITRSGIFTTYPWPIGEVGSVLTVPTTHSSSQVSYGTTWIELTNNLKKTNANLITRDKNNNGVANYYLTTNGNTAMIQTGHSNCSASIDEQKIIANIIFHMYYTYVNVDAD